MKYQKTWAEIKKYEKTNLWKLFAWIFVISFVANLLVDLII